MGCSSSKNLRGVSSPATALIIPQPVFVIKTMKETTDEKFFINVLILEDSAITPSEVMISDISMDVDKRNHECHIIDFVCSPLIVEYPPKEVQFNPQFSKFCLWCMKLTRDTLVRRGMLQDTDTFSSKYSNPRVLNNYKGRSKCIYDKSKVVTDVNFDGEASNSKHHSEAIEELRDKANARKQSVEDAERKKQAVIASSTRILSKDNDKNTQKDSGKRVVENVHNAGSELMVTKQDSNELGVSDDEKDGKRTESKLPSSLSAQTDATKAPVRTSSIEVSERSGARDKASSTSVALQQDSGISKETNDKDVSDSRTVFSKANSLGQTALEKVTPEIHDVEKDADNDGIGANSDGGIRAVSTQSNKDNNINNAKRYRTEGYGEKLARGAVFKNWKKRYFVLSSDKVEYFTDQSKLDKKGEYFIDQTTSIQRIKGSSTMFLLSSEASGTMKVDAPNSKERDEWIDTIDFHVSNLRLSTSKK